MSIVARQPILDSDQALWGYELLFRDSMQASAAVQGDPNQMSSTVFLEALVSIGLDRLVGPHRAFCNVPRDLLLGGHYALLPKDRVVLELLESIEPDAEVIAATERMKAKGYTIALDDYEGHEAYEPLVAMADIIKLDVLVPSLEEVAAQVAPLRGRVRLLAERVETQAVFEACKAMGFTLFQGYFFAKPQNVRGQGLEPVQTAALELIAALNAPDADREQLGRIIEGDVALTYDLLRLVNSPFMGLRKKVGSIEAAQIALGQDRVRNWATLVVMRKLGAQRPAPLMRSGQWRASFMRAIAGKCGRFTITANAASMVGLLSVLDGLLGVPMEAVLGRLGFEQDIERALLARKGPLGALLALAESAERGDWSRMTRAATALKISFEDIAAVTTAAFAEVEQLS